MDPINKPALRTAMLIRAQLAGGPRHDLPIYLPEYSWNNLQRLQRQIGLARQHGWYGAAKQLTEDLTCTLDACRRELENAHRALQSHSPHRDPSPASDIYRDILALHEEFEEVEINLDEHTLSVTTDRIVLEDIRFGRFEIKLDWRLLNTSSAYRVVALEPNPAARSEDITHPHVQDERVCEGDGRAAIRAALGECRLHDFFVLVSQLLHTYGRGSAYTELADWSGTPCEDCGTYVDEDERYHCQHCDTMLCGSCAVPCAACGDHYCTDCLGNCAACGEEHCSSCLKKCSACHQRFCDDCMEDGLCRSCHETLHNEEPEDDSTTNDAIGQPADDSPGSRQRRPVCAPA